MEDIEEVKRKYKLSDKEHYDIQTTIMSLMFYNKYPVDNPRAIIDIAPPASGKTGLNGYGRNQFKDENVVVINSDEFKPHHPKSDEIARLYPQFYTKVTDQESNTWTSAVFDKALQDGYNVIFEGTGRNARILDTIRTKMKGYNVSVRGLAVNELNCLLSIIERYELQVATKGWGRLVTLDHFYETYREMPNTIETIERANIVDAVEVFKRGELPTKPIKIYDSIDRENGRFPSARSAVLGGRVEDERLALQNLDERLYKVNGLLLKRGASEETMNIFKKIESLRQKNISNIDSMER